MKLSWMQVLFIIGAVLMVHGFARMAMTAEQRRLCTPVCALQPHYAAANRLAPDFELPTLDGATVRLSDFRGKVVVLNFWTRTCRPCREEMPALAELARKANQRDDVVVLTVNTDDSAESAREILESLLEGPIPFPVALDPERTIVTGRYGTRLLPETWFIDPEGIIRARFDGAVNWADPMVLTLIETLREPQRCDVEFSGGRAVAGPTDVCQM